MGIILKMMPLYKLVISNLLYHEKQFTKIHDTICLGWFLTQLTKYAYVFLSNRVANYYSVISPKSSKPLPFH